MKNSFLIYSAIVAVVLCWAVLFKLMHWPGAALVRLTEVVLCLVAVVWGASVQTMLGKGVTIYNAIVLVLTIVSWWFCVAHWPGGTIVLALCMSILLPVGIVWSVVSWLKQNQ